MNRQLGKLDVAYIRRWLGEFADVAENPDLAGPFEETLKAAEGVAAKRKKPS